jgi:PAB1-binding protein PBP1
MVESRGGEIDYSGLKSEAVYSEVKIFIKWVFRNVGNKKSDCKIALKERKKPNART